MANPIKGEVSLEIGGKRYVFVLGTYALVALERRVQMPWPKYIQGATKGEWGYEQVLIITQIALLRHHGGLTEEQVASLIDEATPNKIMEVISECMKLMLPETTGSTEEADVERPTMPGNGRGMTSSPTG